MLLVFLLCLYGLGTNADLKRGAAGDEGGALCPLVEFERCAAPQLLSTYSDV